MERDHQQIWLSRMVDEDVNGIVSVGGLAMLAEPSTVPSAVERSALSQLVQWQRRKLQLSATTLAKKAAVDLEAILMLETGKELPETKTILKIANALELPPDKLMTLAGHVAERDPLLENAALRFAACSAPVQALTAEETLALEEFVRVLGE